MKQKNNFKGYKLQFTPHAEKDLKKLDRRETAKIDKKLNALITGAPNLDIKKMATEADSTYRLRCGDYRIIFEAHHHIITILVIGIGHRKKVYRGY